MFETLFGAEMPLAMRFFIAFVVVLALIGAFFWLMRRFGAERLGAGASRTRQPRLAVIDAAPVDGRRRLILIRRDNVEHLLMIGGPTDVVIEPNIVRAAAQREMATPSRAAAAAADLLPRPVPLAEGSMWPLQPEPAPARPARVADEPAQWAEPEPPPPPPPPPPAPAAAEIPVRRPEPATRVARTSETGLAGLASELSGRTAPLASESGPARPAPAVERLAVVERSTAMERAAPAERSAAAAPPPPPPPPPPVAAEPLPPSADENLAEMAQRLEAALRRPIAADARVAGRARPVGEPSPAMPESAGARPKPKSLYDSLEQEMASLLGRPAGKA